MTERAPGSAAPSLSSAQLAALIVVGATAAVAMVGALPIVFWGEEAPDVGTMMAAGVLLVFVTANAVPAWESCRLPDAAVRMLNGILVLLVVAVLGIVAVGMDRPTALTWFPPVVAGAIFLELFRRDRWRPLSQAPTCARIVVVLGSGLLIFAFVMERSVGQFRASLPGYAAVAQRAVDSSATEDPSRREPGSASHNGYKYLAVKWSSGRLPSGGHPLGVAEDVQLALPASVRATDPLEVTALALVSRGEYPIGTFHFVDPQTGRYLSNEVVTRMRWSATIIDLRAGRVVDYAQYEGTARGTGEALVQLEKQGGVLAEQEKLSEFHGRPNPYQDVIDFISRAR